MNNSFSLKKSSEIISELTYNQAVTYISENKELFIDTDNPTDAEKTYDNMVEFTSLVGYFNSEVLYEIVSQMINIGRMASDGISRNVNPAVVAGSGLALGAAAYGVHKFRKNKKLKQIKQD
jgi:hypothetical protein